MENTSKLPIANPRDLFYYRQRSKNRLFEAITSFYAEEAERRGITKKDIADALKRDPSQITRWLTMPSNLTSESISDLLFILGAEMDYTVSRFAERPKANYIHPLIASALGRAPQNIEIVRPPEKPAKTMPVIKINNGRSEVTNSRDTSLASALP